MNGASDDRYLQQALLSASDIVVIYQAFSVS